MKRFLAFTRLVDRINERFGVVADWLVMLSCLISAGNAFSRYAFSISSNAWLEIQWYMFGAVVMLGASYTLKRNEHVRVDIVYSNLSTRRQISELIKRIAMLTGHMKADLHYERPLQ